MDQVKYKVGQDVSYCIGGDSYHDSKITRITDRFIFTESGKKYTRKVDRDGMVYYTQTGSRFIYLTAGIHNYLDPHF